MPQLNTSDAVRQRVEALVEKLLAYANHDLSDCDHLRSKLSVRWADEDSPTPKLIVNTELRFLTELVFNQQSHALKELIKQDLSVLKKFLGILQDNRTKTQGSPDWHFTLTLWHRSIPENLQELQQEWQRRKGLTARSVASKPSANQTSANQTSATQPFANSLQTLATQALGTQSPADIPTQARGDRLPTLSPFISPPLPSPSPSADPTFTAIPSPYPCHNLPACSHTHFVGRQHSLNQLLDLLRADRPTCRIAVEGIGGVGKTSLVVEAAYRCLQPPHRDSPPFSAAPQFDAIIFTSGKLHHLTPRGILPRLRQERTLHQIFRAIARTLGYLDLPPGDLARQFEWVQTLLMRQRSLLIIDHLDTLAEQQEILACLYELPATVKIILTSCQPAMMDVSIRLEPLHEEEGLAFIAQQTQIKAVPLQQDEAQCLYQATGGIPAAIVYAIGQLANGYRFQDALPRLTMAEGDYCRFYFEGSVRPLRGQPAHRVLMALALFPQPALREAIAPIAFPEHEQDPDQVDTALTHALATLQQLSLVTLRGERYTMLPLTRDYALNELTLYPTFEQLARERWVNGCLDMLQHYGQSNWREWQDYTSLNDEWENIQAVIEWCIEQEKYKEFNLCWQVVKGYIHQYGYWHERLIWTDWWLTVCQQQADEATLVQALCDRSWTLMLLGNASPLREAEEWLTQAWDMRSRIEPDAQLELAIDRAILALHQHHHEAVHLRLQTARQYLEQIQLEPSQRLRQDIRINYYEAEAWYHSGDYDQAKRLYHHVLEQTRQIQWKQVEIYTLNWLADIGLKQSHVHEAAALLNQSWPMAERYRDKRSMAFHCRTWAQIEQQNGNLPQFQHWSRQAQRYFEDLGMDAETREMRAWAETPWN